MNERKGNRMAQEQEKAAVNPVSRQLAIQPNNDDGEIEIDLVELFFNLLEHAFWIILVSILFAVGSGVFTVYMIKPKYSATSGLYVMSRQDSAINLSDLQIGSSLTMDYQEVFNNWHVQENVLQRLNLNYTYDQLGSMIKLRNPNNTRVLYITATSGSPDEAKNLADTYAQVAREFIAATMDTQQPSIFMEALWPSRPSSPSLSKNILIGFAIGFVLSAGIFVVHFLLDDRVRGSEDVEKYLNMPLLGMMPKEKKSSKSNRKAEKERRK